MDKENLSINNDKEISMDLNKKVSNTLFKTEKLLMEIDALVNGKIKDIELREEVIDLINNLKVEFQLNLNNISQFLEEE